MKILQKYIVREISAPFLFGLLVFTFILILDKIFDMVELIVNRGVDVWSVFKLFIYVLPALIAITVPMAVLLSGLMSFGRLSSDNEITATNASGVNIISMAWPCLVLSFLLSCGMVWFNHAVLPRANHAFRNLYFDIVRQRASIALREKIFINDFDGYILYVDRKNQTGGLEKVLIYSLGAHNQPLHTVLAPTGQIISDPVARRVILRLNNGEIHYPVKEDPAYYDLIKFKSYNIDLDINRSFRMGGDAGRGFREMSITEMVNELKRLQYQKINTNNLLVEIHKRISIPFACVAFFLVAFPLGLRIRAGKAIGFGISIIFIIIYYYLEISGELLGNKGFSPFLALWMPNLVIGGMGVYMLRQVILDRPFIRFRKSYADSK